MPPASTPSRTLSLRNCFTSRRRVAPSATRTPISRTRVKAPGQHQIRRVRACEREHQPDRGRLKNGGDRNVVFSGLDAGGGDAAECNLTADTCCGAWAGSAQPRREQNRLQLGLAPQATLRDGDAL